MRVDLLTREYPPEVYGGAGVHVEYLARELRRLVDVRVHCFGAPRDEAGVTAYSRPRRASPARTPALQHARHRPGDGRRRARAPTSCTRHTWYANFAGHVAKMLHGVPHVVTTHSLEPLRPWKAEQLGGGYALSSWAERTAIEAADAVIAVSAGMRDDVLRCYPGVDPAAVHVIHNGIDTEEYAPDPGTDVLETHGIDPDRPVGRLRRADHPAEGAAAPAARGAVLRPAGASSCCCAGRAGHPGDRGRGRRCWSTALRADRDGRRLDRRDAAQAARSSRSSPTPPCSSARRSTSRWAS